MEGRSCAAARAAESTAFWSLLLCMLTMPISTTSAQNPRISVIISAVVTAAVPLQFFRKMRMETPPDFILQPPYNKKRYAGHNIHGEKVLF